MSNREIPTRKVITNENLPTLYIDGIHISHRKDGMNYLSLRTALPDSSIEQVRLMINDHHLISIIDTICRVIEYFPEKHATKRKQPSK